MTRKHFEAIAAVLAGEWTLSTTKEGRRVVFNTTLSLADVFAQANARFDRDKFYQAVFGTDMDTARDVAFGW